MYSLPVKRADLAGVDGLLRAGRWPLSHSSSVKFVRVGAVDLEHEAHRVAHLGEQRDPALEVGAGEQLVEAARPRSVCFAL